MDIPNPTRHRPIIHTNSNNKPSPSVRFLGAYPHAPPTTNPNDSSDELTEDDIFWTNNGSNHHHNQHSAPPSSSASTLLRYHKDFSQPETFGILAALPERQVSSPNPRSHSHFYHKASASSSPPSYAQMIPFSSSSSSSLKYQSAPVNIPVLAAAMRKKQQQQQGELETVVDEDDGEVLPPHEIVARSSAHSPMLACSVLEGVGRTLKGRDLRRVRNAVWRRTGFID